MWSYDPADGTWTERRAHPVGSRYGFSAANLDGQLVISGGRGWAGEYIDDSWAYNTQANQWSRLAMLSGTQPITLPATAKQATAASGNSMYIFGGEGADGAERNTVWQLQFTRSPTVSVSSLAALPAARKDAAATILPPSGFGPQAGPGTVLIFGGLRAGQAIAETTIYDIGWPYRLHLPVLVRSYQQQ